MQMQIEPKRKIRSYQSRNSVEVTVVRFIKAQTKDESVYKLYVDIHKLYSFIKRIYNKK